jgi:hypothetical protein
LEKVADPYQQEKAIIGEVLSDHRGRTVLLMRTGQIILQEVEKVDSFPMPYKPSEHEAKSYIPPSSEDLKRTFEVAVREIHRADSANAKALRAGLSIVPRSRILGLSSAGAEKRAISDAARALAMLWKV